MKTDLFSALVDDAAAFRADTRRQVVALARRRRRGRAIRQVAGAAATVVCVALLLKAWLVPPSSVQTGEPVRGFVVVESRPLAPGTLLRTSGAAFLPVAGGRNFGEIAIIHSRPGNIAITETRLAMPAFDYWNDRQLLAAFPDQRAALVNPGTARARLIFY